MGVRVPKTLTNALDSLVNSERGREILASALVAAASAAAAALVKRSDSPQVDKAREAAIEAGDQVASGDEGLDRSGGERRRRHCDRCGPLASPCVNDWWQL